MSECLAISVWNDQVSTTYDFAKQLVVIKAERGREISRETIAVQEEPAPIRARRLQHLGVQVLLCGGISRPLARAMMDAGIEVIPYVSGPVDTVLAAYLCGNLTRPCFLQPGCRSGARRRWRHSNRCRRQEQRMV